MSACKPSGEKRDRVQRQVLEDLLDGIDIVGELMSLPPHAGPRHNFEYHMARKEWDRMYGKEMKERRALKKMREGKWVEERQIGNRILVRIHSDAIVASLKDRILRTKNLLTNGGMTLLCFDFPNGATKARNQWRGLIRRLGLKKEQLSVYSSTLNIADELCALIKMLGAEKWIRVFVANEKSTSPP